MNPVSLNREESLVVTRPTTKLTGITGQVLVVGVQKYKNVMGTCDTFFLPYNRPMSITF